MAYTLEDVERMASDLRTLPAMDSAKRKLTKQAAIKHLAREIASLQKRGYSIEQVVDSLRGVGLDISTPTLKSYLHRSKKRQGKDGWQKAPRTEVVRAPARPAASAATLPVTDAKPDGTAIRSGKNAFLVKDKDSY